MSKSESPTIVGDSYYECIPCGYTARVDQAIGLCPRCGDDLTVPPTLD
jgi:rubrerythrin